MHIFSTLMGAAKSAASHLNPAELVSQLEAIDAFVKRGKHLTDTYATDLDEILTLAEEALKTREPKS